MTFRTFLAAALILSGAPAFAGDADVITAASGDAKAGEYDANVLQAVVNAYDSNGSGAVDSGKELKAISCPVWMAMEAGVAAGWDGTGVRTIYGFKKGFIWVGYAFGFDEKVRKSADKAMAKCGIG